MESIVSQGNRWYDGLEPKIFDQVHYIVERFRTDSAKWQEPMGAGQLALLQRVRELLVRNRQPAAETARLLCFGGAEPSGQLRRAADAGEVRLIGLDEL